MNRLNSQIPTHNPPLNSGGSMSFGQILVGFWGRKWAILMFMSLVMIGTYLILAKIQPIYNAETKILIQGHDPETNRFSVNTQSSPPDLLKVSSEAQVIQSHQLVDKVTKTLNLKNYSEFTGGGGSSFFGLGGNKKSNLSATEQVRDTFYKNLTVYPIAETRVIVIDFKSHNAKRAAAAANELARVYVENTRQTSFNKNAQTNTYLGKQIKKLRSDILTAEKGIEKFRARNGLVQGNEGTLYAQELAELNRQIAEVSAVRAEASAKAASAKRLLGGDQSIDIAADVINSNLIQRLREEQIKLRRLITENSITYLPAHPEMVQLNNQLQNLDRLVAFEVTKIAASLTDQARIAAARENTLRGKLNRLKSKAVGQGQSTAKLKALERDIGAKRTLLNTYLSKQADTLSRADVSNVPYGARIISNAVAAATPAFPKKGPILFLSFVSALVLAFVVSFLLDISRGQPVLAASSPAIVASAQHQMAPQSAPHVTRQGIGGMAQRVGQLIQPRPQQNMQNHMHAPNTIPNVPTASSPNPMSSFNLAISDSTDLATLYAGNNQLATGLNQLASHAHLCLQSSGSKHILVTSQDKFPQKSFISAGLARIFAQQGLKTVVVDADMLNPTISQIMGVQPGPGFSEVLIGAHPFSESVVKDKNTGAAVIPAGMRGQQAYSQLASESATMVMRSLSLVYDIIIIHAPALSEHAGVQSFTSEAPFVCLAGSNAWGEKQRLANTGQQLIANGASHVTQINCSAKSGGGLAGLFKSKAA